MTRRTIAIWNRKGGSGKTTTAVNLAAALADRGARVLLIDLDPQGNASLWIGERNDGTALLAVLTDGRPIAPLLTETRAPGVTLVPGGPRLVQAESVLPSLPAADRRLARALARLDAWDYVLLDTPPAGGLLTANALEAADEVLIPVDTSALGLDALAAVLEVLRQSARFGCRIAVAGILVCRYGAGNNISREIVASLGRSYPDLTLRTVIRENVRLRESPSHGLPIDAYAPGSAGALDYAALAAEISARTAVEIGESSSMPARKTLGSNLGQAGGMMAALGFQQPSATPAGGAADEKQPAPPPPPKPPTARPELGPPAPRRPAIEAVEAEVPATEVPPAVSRIATDLSTARLDLAKRAAYWNRETLRSFLERAIEAEAERIAREQGLPSLPAAPSLRRGRPLRE